MGLGSFVDINIFVYEIFFYLFSLYSPFLLNLLNQNLQYIKTPKRKLESFVQWYSFKFWAQANTNRDKENCIEGGGDWVSVHFAVTFLDCWRSSFCVTTIIKIVNNNTKYKQTSGISGALDEDSPYTNSCLFTLDRLLFYCCYAKTSS